METKELIMHLRRLGKYSTLEPNYLLMAADRLEEFDDAENEEDYDTTINKIKAEAYKEFADMVKKKGVKVGVDEICIFTNTLDNLLKEMVGDK